FSPAGVTSPFVARAKPTGGSASVMPVRNERAGVCQPRDCLSLFVSCLASAPRDIQANASATRAVPLAQLDVVDRDWRRRLPGPPFLAAQSSRNEPVRLDQRFSEDRLPALRVEGDDATPLRCLRGARLLPSERTPPHFRPPTHLEP